METLESKITAVTIFTDRAQITRTANIVLAKGEQTVNFSDLPKSIEQKSIQVSGEGNAILNDIKFKQVYYEEIQHEEIKVLFGKIEDINKEIKIISDTLTHAHKEKELVEKIAEKLTFTSEKEQTTPVLDPEKWIKMVEFYRNKYKKLDEEIRGGNEKMKNLNKKILKLNKEIKQLGANQGKTKNQVEVVLMNNSDKELKLTLTYIVYNATWYPVYDLRVSTEQQNMNVAYNAMLEQNTGEDWENVKISLSTAQVQISGTQPELTAWYVDIYKPVVESPVSYKRESRTRSPKKKMMKKMDEGLDMNMMNAMMKSGKGTPPPLMKKPQAKVKTGATSVVFNIAGTNTVKSDNNPHKVSILLQEFPSEFTYSTIPKLSQYAYLKAKVTNKTDFPFLPGESNIFLDNSFVATSHLKQIAPSEEFLTSLGIDEGMKVEYKLIKKYEKEKGLISKKRNIIFEYQIIITNNKKRTEKIIVFDQLPISQNEDIKVELIKPKYKEDTDTLKINKQKFVEWHFEPESKEKLVIDYIYSVESPTDEQITGIDI